MPSTTAPMLCLQFILSISKWNQNWPQMPGSSTSLFIQRAKRKISRMTTKLGGTASSPTTREEIALQHCWYIIISFLISQSVSSTSKASLPLCCTCRRRRPKSYPCVSTGTRSMRDIHSCVDMIISHTGCFLLLRPKNALKSVSTLRKPQKLPPPPPLKKILRKKKVKVLELFLPHSRNSSDTFLVKIYWGLTLSGGTVSGTVQVL